VFTYIIDVGSQTLITLVDRAIPYEVSSVFSPSRVFCFVIPFAESVKWGALHIFYMYCTQTWKSLCSFAAFTYAPRDPILSSWYVPRCRRKNASLRNAATASRSTTISTFWRCLLGVVLDWWTVRSTSRVPEGPQPLKASLFSRVINLRLAFYLFVDTSGNT